MEVDLIIESHVQMIHNISRDCIFKIFTVF